MMKNDLNRCPKCQEQFQTKDLPKCKSCGFVPQSTKDFWKSRNLGKQRGKKKADGDSK